MIETRTIKTYGNMDGSDSERAVFQSYMNYIKDLSAFGWKIQSDNHRIGDVYNTSNFVFLLVRDTKMPHYDRIKELEEVYEDARAQLKHYEEANIHLAVFLFFLFIIPGVLYIVIKSAQKSAANVVNEPLYRKMRKATKEADGLQ